MALRLRSSKDVKKSSYYVWYLGAREAKGVDAMPGAIAYLLERERLQEPFKVTLQVSGTISEIRFRGRKYRAREREREKRLIVGVENWEEHKRVSTFRPFHLKTTRRNGR